MLDAQRRLTHEKHMFQYGSALSPVSSQISMFSSTRRESSIKRLITLITLNIYRLYNAILCLASLLSNSYSHSRSEFCDIFFSNHHHLPFALFKRSTIYDMRSPTIIAFIAPMIVTSVHATVATPSIQDIIDHWHNSTVVCINYPSIFPHLDPF